MAIKCVMFDFGNVLVHFDTPRFYAFLQKHKRSSLKPEEMFTGAGSAAMIDYDLGKVDDLEYYERTKDLFKLEDTTFEEFFDILGDVMNPDPKMLNLKLALRSKGLQLVLISNINRFHLNCASLKYPEFIIGFDYQALSCSMGVRKPDPEMWIRPLDFLGLKPEECLFVDDYKVNVRAFRELGGLGYHYSVNDHSFCPNGKLKQEREKLFSTCRNLGLIS